MVQIGAKAKGLDNKEQLYATVVCAVKDGADGQTEGELEFVASSSCICGHAYTYTKM